MMTSINPSDMALSPTGGRRMDHPPSRHPEQSITSHLVPSEEPGKAASSASRSRLRSFSPLAELRARMNLLKQINLIWAVQSSLQKYFCFRLTQITSRTFRIPSHTEGRFAIVTDVGHGMRWTRQRFARDGIAGRVERLVSDHRRADERCCSVR